MGPRSRDVRGETPQELRARIERDGGLAAKNLVAWRRAIPEEDRYRMAERFDALIARYAIKPRDLTWKGEFRTAEEYRNALSRCRQRPGSTPKQKINADAHKWLRMLDLVRDALAKRGTLLSREAVVDEVTRGTRFHPMQRAKTFEEKLVAAIERYADTLASRHGLIPHYREVSAMRAQHFRQTGGWLDSDYAFVLSQSWLDVSVSQLFGAIPDDLRDTRVADLTPAEWDAFKMERPAFLWTRVEEALQAFWRGEITDLSRAKDAPDAHVFLLTNTVSALYDPCSDPALANVSAKRMSELSGEDWSPVTEHLIALGGWQNFDWPSVAEWRRDERALRAYAWCHHFRFASILQFPHTVIGVMDYNLPAQQGIFDAAVTGSPTYWAPLLKSGLGTVLTKDLLESIDSTDGPLQGLVVLVLLPDLEANRIVPHVACMYDGPACQTLARETEMNVAESPDSDGPFPLLAPFDPGYTPYLKPTLQILEDDLERIFADLDRTAGEVRRHDPYLKHRVERAQKFDALLSQQWDSESLP